MFIPQRLIYRTPEASQPAPSGAPSEEPLKAENFLDKLDKVEFDKKNARQFAKDVLNNTKGYKLIKAEACVASGRITTREKLESAASLKDVTDGELDAFLAQRGGDRFLKRLFTYGVSSMKRDFLKKQRNFESDKADRRRWFAKQKAEGTAGDYRYKMLEYETFEDAFNAGFYKGLRPDLQVIMDYGLSVEEYRNYSGRLRALRAKFPEEKKEVDQTGTQQPGAPRAPGAGTETGTQQSRAPREEGEQASVLDANFKTLAREATAAYSLVDRVKAHYQKKKPELFTSVVLAQFLNVKDADEYLVRFSSEKIAIKGFSVTFEQFVHNPTGFPPEVAQEFDRVYSDFIKDQKEILSSLESILYQFVIGYDPRGFKRLEDKAGLIVKAKEGCPEILGIEKQKKALDSALRAWKKQLEPYKASK